MHGGATGLVHIQWSDDCQWPVGDKLLHFNCSVWANLSAAHQQLLERHTLGGRRLRELPGAPTFRSIAATDLPTSGVAANTYRSVTVDTYGRVTAASNPTTLSGYGITDSVQNASGVPSMSSGLDASLPSAGTAGRIYFATDTKKIYRDNGVSWDVLSSAAGSGGTVTSVATGTGLSGGPVTGTGTISLASTAVTAASYGSASQVPTFTVNAQGQLTAASNVTITGTAPGGAAGGDLTGSYPNPTLGKISGTTVTIAALASGNYLRYNGTIWQNSGLTSGDISTALGFAPINAGQMPANCSSNQTLTFSSPTGTWACSAISVTGSAFGSQVAAFFLAAPTAASGAPTFRGIASGDLPITGSYGVFENGGNSFGQAAILGTNDANSLTLKTNNSAAVTVLSGGSVGIGTTSPAYILDMAGNTARISGGNYAQFSMVATGTGGRDYRIGSTDNGNGLGGGNFTIYDQTAGASRLLVNSSGNVGIGTTSPNTVLDVNGAFSMRGMAIPAVSPAGQGRIYFDSSSNNFQISQNGGGYTALATTGGAQTFSSDITMSGTGTGLAVTNGETVGGTLAVTGATSVTNATASTSSSTGALTVGGGAGIGGDLFAGASVNAATTMKAGTSLTTPQIYGSTAASGNIKIDGTSNTPAGNVLLASTGGDVGIGTTSPDTSLTVSNGAASASIAHFFAPNITNGNLAQIVVGKDNTTNYAQGALTYAYNSTTPSDSFVSLGNSTVNSAQLNVLGNGNVGIGTTSPSLAKLQTAGIVGNTAAMFGSDTTGVSIVAAYPSIAFNSYYNAGFLSMQTGYGGMIMLEQTAGAMTFDTAATVTGQGTAQSMNERMRISNSGNVGIGTSTPILGAPLTVASANYPDGTGDYAGTAILSTAASATDNGGSIGFGGPCYGCGAGSNMLFGTISGRQQVSNGYMGYLQFSTRTNSTYSTERMRITSQGNVGIGTTSPGGKLTVAQDVVMDTYGENPQLKVGGTTNTSRALKIGYDTTNNFGWIYASDSSVAAKPLVLQPTVGNVGIGTTSPVSALNVLGSVAGGTPSLSADTGSIATFTSPTTVQIQMGALGGGNYAAWIQSKVDGQNNAYPLALNPAGGAVGIGTTSPNGKLGLTWDPSAQQGLWIQSLNETYYASPIVFANSGSGVAGYISQSTSAVSYNTASDRRTKENIVPTTIGLDDLMRIQVYDYDFIRDPKHKRTTGFIAQEVNQIFPDAVSTNGDNGETELSSDKKPWAVDYGRLTPLLVQAMKELKTVIDSIYLKLASYDKTIATVADKTVAQERDIASVKSENEKLKQENIAIKAYLCNKDPNATICEVK